MSELIFEYFNSVGINHFSVLKYSDCREINERLRISLDFEPKSVIMFLVPYYAGETVNLSRYAASLDYHLILREITEGLATHLGKDYPDAHFAGYGDHSPIDEVGAALISGLGIRGDNGLIINSEYGSYVFIGDLLTDIDPDLLGAKEPVAPLGCHHCGACAAACPTGILRGEGNDCLSAITQRKGELSDHEIALMKKYNTVWGCDMCQSACPYNKKPKLTPVPFFHRERIPELTLEILNGMTRVEFLRRAFAWRGRKTVERNLNYFTADN